MHRCAADRRRIRRSAIALVEAGSVERVMSSVEAGYEQRMGRQTAAFVCQPSQGASWRGTRHLTVEVGRRDGITTRNGATESETASAPTNAG